MTGSPLEAEGMPFVSVVMPVRNEAEFIEASLEAVLRQDYPADAMEVILVDGDSDDGTPDVVRATAERVRAATGRAPRLEVLANPDRVVPISLNMAIERARGDVIARVDGHCVVEPHYLRTCVAELHRTGADCVGGLAEAAGEGVVAGAIALALASPFGVGRSHFRYSRTPGEVTTVFLPAYRREVFERIGGFDPEFVRTQDSELHFRLIRAGGRIWFTPDIRAVYFGRRSLRALWRQYFQYGTYKYRLARKHGTLPSRHQLVAPAFVASLAASVAAGLVAGTILRRRSVAVPAAAAVPAVYAAANAAFSTAVAARRGWRYLPALPAAFAVVHVSWGVGFWAGVVRFGLPGTRDPKEPGAAPARRLH